MHQYELITKLTRQLDKSIKLLNKIKELTAPYSNVMPSSMIYAFCFKALQEAEGME